MTPSALRLLASRVAELRQRELILTTAYASLAADLAEVQLSLNEADRDYQQARLDLLGDIHANEVVLETTVTTVG